MTDDDIWDRPRGWPPPWNECVWDAEHLRPLAAALTARLPGLRVAVDTRLPADSLTVDLFDADGKMGEVYVDRDPPGSDEPLFAFNGERQYDALEVFEFRTPDELVDRLLALGYD